MADERFTIVLKGHTYILKDAPSEIGGRILYRGPTDFSDEIPRLSYDQMVMLQDFLANMAKQFADLGKDHPKAAAGTPAGTPE